MYITKAVFSLLVGIGVFISGCSHTAVNPNSERLATVLAAQAEENKVRYSHRNPKATLQFFGIKPGMKVAEVLPGRGWYTKILLPYLGKEGSLTGIDYAFEMWSHFGGFANEEFIEKRRSWTKTWLADARQWRDDQSANVFAATLSTMPENSKGSLDAVLFIRAMHNLMRFSDQGDYLNKAIAAAYTALKPGGIVGIVQHQAREDRPDDWANGRNGYLKKSAVKAAMQAAGFEFVGESSVNENPRDQAGEGDFVWRLPPVFSGSNDEEQKKAMQAIGESHRMTLKFIKPTQ